MVRYRASGACRLRVGVFLAYRDYHALSHANGALDGTVREEGRTVRLRPYAGLPELRLHHGGARVERGGDWYHRTEYLAELERGLDFQKDLWRACALELDLPPGGETFVAATLGDRRIDATVVETLERAERDRRRTPYADPLTARLSIAADHYLVRRADEIQSTIVSGSRPEHLSRSARRTIVSRREARCARRSAARGRGARRRAAAHRRGRWDR